MGILDKALKTVKNVGDSLVESATNAGSSVGTSVQDLSLIHISEPTRPY